MSSSGPKIENPGGSGSLKDALVQKFLTSDSHIKWGALGVALTGGTVYSVLIGGIRGVLSVGAAVDLFVGRIDGTIETQTTRLFDSLNRQLGDVWSVGIDLGVAQLPFNLVIALAALAILALGVRELGS